MNAEGISGLLVREMLALSSAAAVSIVHNPCDLSFAARVLPCALADGGHGSIFPSIWKRANHIRGYNESRMDPPNSSGRVIRPANRPRIGSHALVTFGLVQCQERRHAGFKGRQRVLVLVPFLTDV